jgi:hypothetical protein
MTVFRPKVLTAIRYSHRRRERQDLGMTEAEMLDAKALGALDAERRGEPLSDADLANLRRWRSEAEQEAAERDALPARLRREHLLRLAGYGPRRDRVLKPRVLRAIRPLKLSSPK